VERSLRCILSRRHVSLGLYGGALPLVLGPLGYTIARLLDFPSSFHRQRFPIALPIGLALYYLAWKYIVGFLNTELGIANEIPAERVFFLYVQ